VVGTYPAVWPYGYTAPVCAIDYRIAPATGGTPPGLLCPGNLPGQVAVEGVTARHAGNLAEALNIMQQGEIPVLVDPHAESLNALHSSLSPHQPWLPTILVDGRMAKQPIEPGILDASLVIGLGQVLSLA